MKFQALLAILMPLWLLPCSTEASDNEINSFREAKKTMVKIVHSLDKPKTIYCGCDIVLTKNGYYPNLESCSYKIRKNEKRAKRIEAEHIMPAHEFGKNRSCWISGGRQNCTSSDPTFMKMEGDLHNLFPAIGEVNGDRSNFKFSEKLRGTSPYGKCEVIIDRKRQRAMIPDRAKGQVARAYLYMSNRYHIPLDNEHINLFNQWNKKFKPTYNECLYNKLATKAQGNDNPFVTKACKY